MLGNIKGAVLREFVLYCEQYDDRERLKRALDAVQVAYPNDVDPTRSGGGFLASRWYPAELVHLLVDEVIKGRSEGEQDALARSAARVIMGRSLTGVYRFLFSTFATPELYARHVNKLWSMHYDNGFVQIDTEPRTGKLRLAHRRISRWSSHHRFVCKLNAAATVPIYEALGATDVHYEALACVSQGDPHCEWLVRWVEGE